MGRLALVIIAALQSVEHGVAQDYPTKPIRMLVGFPAGSSLDTIARYTTGAESDAARTRARAFRQARYFQARYRIDDPGRYFTPPSRSSLVSPPVTTSLISCVFYRILGMIGQVYRRE